MERRHGFPCAIRKVKKEGLKKRSTAFLQSERQGDHVSVFWVGTWTEREQSHVFLDPVNFGKAPLEKQSCNKNNHLATEFMHDFESKLNL
jgi:hypothetical protein